MQNSLDVRVEHVEMVLGDLPNGFDNTRLLFITDLHLDGVGTLADRVLSIAGGLDYDLCVLGGDYTCSRTEACGRTYPQITKIAKKLRDKSRVFGILGDYHPYSMAELLDSSGVKMLLNDAVCLERKGDRIYLAGLDDGSHYNADDIELADRSAWEGAFKIMICHSPAQHKAVVP